MVVARTTASSGIAALDNGSTLLSDDVDITVNIEAAKSVAAIKEEVKTEKH